MIEKLKSFFQQKPALAWGILAALVAGFFLLRRRSSAGGVVAVPVPAGTAAGPTTGTAPPSGSPPAEGVDVSNLMDRVTTILDRSNQSMATFMGRLLEQDRTQFTQQQTALTTLFAQMGQALSEKLAPATSVLPGEVPPAIPVTPGPVVIPSNPSSPPAAAFAPYQADLMVWVDHDRNAGWRKQSVTINNPIEEQLYRVKSKFYTQDVAGKDTAPLKSEGAALRQRAAEEGVTLAEWAK